ncbi:hypothetical protein BU24DRAFT_366243 [Aaosphaeria arxii CBS 175.79]|uniref:MYND-type domain-containing protein n=1 Tax=Aaosphaeria arxii CBS 175.79 TaxID=1450172 RepID=A0A6A5XV63_9PLEO|nr:uncharacterized protein BU24DRAFT_366243 [Aaosphaeria arxii CBS 175.79]KAF2016823.1 hypothetical protein BU24DRAFT_366243 [Aaosphaeria arxii CBS 175.79]
MQMNFQLRTLRYVDEMICLYNKQGSGNSGLSRAYLDAAQIVIANGDLARGRILAERAVEGWRTSHGSDSKEVAEYSFLVQNPASLQLYGLSMEWKSSIDQVPQGLERNDFEDWLWRREKPQKLKQDCREVSKTSLFLDPALCANTQRKINGEIMPCRNEAGFICAKCKLVQYCCKECQTADWKHHKGVCRSKFLNDPYLPGWVVENRVPAFVSGPPLATFGSLQYLWGNVPAVDILKIKDNEGEEVIMGRDVALLFAASGDLRNVVKTIVGLPRTFAGNCTVVLNDMNTVITARNAMLLLVALHFEPEIAAPVMLHLWYSAMIPEPIFQALRNGVLTLIQDVCTKIKDKPPQSLQAKTFDLGGRTLRLLLKQQEWMAFANMFRVPVGLDANQAQSIRRAVTLARVDHVDRHIYKMSPGRRAGAMDFRQHGVLLPFGASRKDFTVPNPTFFNAQGQWPMKDDADPLDDWSYDEYIKSLRIARNDVYGAFFFYLRDLLLEFCTRVHSVSVSFQLLAVNAVDLPRYLNSQQFDRIEVSNICDRGYLGPSTTLATFSSMLKAKSKSPRATLLMLFLNAVREEERYCGGAFNTKTTALFNRVVREYLDVEQTLIDAIMGKGDMSSFKHMLSPDFYLVTGLLDLCGDFDTYFKRFLDQVGSEKGISMSDVARQHGVRIKSENTIMELWPYRLTESMTKEEVMLLLAEGTTGHERYMEFERCN